MTNAKTIAGFALMTLALAGCSETTKQSSPPALQTGSSADEAACLKKVAKKTNNSVSVLSSDFSEANTIVMVGVGPNKAPWRCLVSKGQVAEIMSMTNEGAL